MSYKTILVNAQASPGTWHVADIAARIAVAEQAHVVGLASSGIKPLLYQCNAVAPGVPLLPPDLQVLTEQARRALADFTATVTRLGAPSCEERLTDDSLADSLLLQSRYCDLLVTARDDVLPQQLILHSPRPVLVAPGGGRSEGAGARPLLAWDGGMAASRAIHAALPLLRRAALTTLAVFNPGRVYAAHGDQPGADLARYLARHGVRLDVVVRETDGDVGAALLSLAADTGADLLVMGCYGHARLTELLLGGATRSVLKHMTLPVLMSR